MKLLLLSIVFLQVSAIAGQDVVCTKQDREAFEQKITKLQSRETDSFQQSIITVGLSFLQTPYVAKTLEIGPKESLVVNLSGLDCTTFVENVLAFSYLLHSGNTDFNAFTNQLEKIRYRDGVLNGYASRLHYFSDWIANNEKKGYMEDITRDIGGEKSLKTINFMSSHRELYPFLKDDLNYNAIKNSEKLLSEQTLWTLKVEDIIANENKIHNGDIIALTTSIDGLDITHTGLAIFLEDERLHLLHASSSGEVKISEEPLSEYLQSVKYNTGIRVARPILVNRD